MHGPIYFETPGMVLADAGLLQCRQRQMMQMIEDLDRPALHAKTLGFEHPVTKQQMMFDSELPADFVAALQQLRTAL